MPLTEQQIDELKAIARSGRSVNVCEYVQVDWDADDPAQTRYYAVSKYNKIPPFGSIGIDIDARLMGEPFKAFELYPDLRTDTIPLVFSDLDKEIRGRFQQYGSGVRVEFFLYYPQVNGHESMWFGQLQAPQIYGWKKIEAVATNGFRSREQLIPRRLRPQECSWGKFGGALTAEALATHGCKYDRHLGGSIGNLNGGVPYTVCTFDPTGCTVRGMAAYYGGFNPDASAVVTDQNSGYLAVTKGNTSNLRNPIRVVAGTKTVRANQLLYWRREMNANNQDRGFVAGVWEVCEGPIVSIRNIKIGEKLIEQIHWYAVFGNIPQFPLVGYAPDISSFPGTAHFMARKGWVDPLTENAQTMSVSECVVVGYKEVTTLTPSVSRIWTNNRTWWLLEFMHNQRFGMSYPLARFNAASWMACADWTGTPVTFSFTNQDGETRNHAHTRSSFDCVVEGRPVAEQLVDICRSGRISVPFQKNGEFHIEPFRAFTQDELDDAPVFTDTGPTQNIYWVEENGKPAYPLIEPSQFPDDKLINEVTLVFEDGAHQDNERPITVDNPNQKLRAGRTLGFNNLQSVPTRIAAFGVRNLNEAVKLGYGILRFGQFDEGGILNNLTVMLEVPLIEALAVRKFGPIKIVSEALDGIELPEDDTLETTNPVEYFRVLNIWKTSKDTAKIKAQAYNHAAMIAFETVPETTPGEPPPWPPDLPDDPNPDPFPIPRGRLPIIDIEFVEYDAASEMMTLRAGVV